MLQERATPIFSVAMHCTNAWVERWSMKVHRMCASFARSTRWLGLRAWICGDSLGVRRSWHQPARRTVWCWASSACSRRAAGLTSDPRDHAKHWYSRAMPSSPELRGCNCKVEVLRILDRERHDADQVTTIIEQPTSRRARRHGSADLNVLRLVF